MQCQDPPLRSFCSDYITPTPAPKVVFTASAASLPHSRQSLSFPGTVPNLDAAPSGKQVTTCPKRTVALVLLPVPAPPPPLQGHLAVSSPSGLTDSWQSS